MRNGIPICKFFSDPRPPLHRRIPICIRRSPYAKLRTWGYKTNFPYAHNFIMYTGSEWKIPVCIQGCKHPRMHMGISVHPIPVCIEGSWKSLYAYRDYILIPVFIRGLHDMWSLYAYGDLSWPPYAYGDLIDPRMHTGIDLDPHMHKGIACHVIPVCIWGSIKSPYIHGDLNLRTIAPHRLAAGVLRGRWIGHQQ